jgi:hypothetical protein
MLEQMTDFKQDEGLGFWFSRRYNPEDSHLEDKGSSTCSQNTTSFLPLQNNSHFKIYCIVIP